MKLSALFLLLLAQAVAPPQFKSGVNFVEVDVVVADRKGVPVRGLRREDFEVTEDGKPVELLTFRPSIFRRRNQRRVIPPLDRSGTSVASNDQPQDGRVLLIVLDDYHVSFDAGRAATSAGDCEQAGRAHGAVRPGGGDVDERAAKHPGGIHERQGQTARGDRKASFRNRKPVPAGSRRRPSPGRGGGRRRHGLRRREIKARWAMDALSSAATGLALIPHRRKAVLLVSQGLPVSVEDIITNSNASDAFRGAPGLHPHGAAQQHRHLHHGSVRARHRSTAAPPPHGRICRRSPRRPADSRSPTRTRLKPASIG